MRVSANKDDPGYQTWGMTCIPCMDILLDSEIVTHVVTADEDVGLVVVTKRDDSGDLVIENNEFVSEILYGKVTVRLKPDSEGEWPHRIPRAIYEDRRPNTDFSTAWWEQ